MVKLTLTPSVAQVEARRRAGSWWVASAAALAAAVVAVGFGLVGAGRASAAPLAPVSPLTVASGAPGGGQVSEWGREFERVYAALMYVRKLAPDESYWWSS